MTKTAWLFPGQGSQAEGMGVDLKDTSIAQERLAQAESILGWSVLEVCQNGKEKLTQTLYTQPCLYAVEGILVDLMRDRRREPQVVAGHSLGEYVALYAAGVFDFESGLRLVQRRAELMDKAEGGKMVALIGFNREALQTEIDKSADVVLANDNSDGQVVISGTPKAVDAVLAQVKTKRAIPLNVSGAFHSPLMAEAAQQFQEVLQSVEFADASVPVLSNVDPTPNCEGEVLKQRLQAQIVGSVRWREIMAQLSEMGIEKAVEVGPGNVLANLLKRAYSDIARENVGSLAVLQA
ncbi:ACP S-malonyltransferase [Lusitaniella coriacea LEGE 07157]|uniref:Malonyl CoA-acyl carrier protein transacylase n=1 Tax=Lusitaniella coriacea LEGE 07157 TaxID=945747 RepID=A0A8J7DVE3_9CYAN|nr:ACP S-malonyltransferase [Lusitaniella coriacea]MBE9115745.1 ACP S-malonyltransferase [Lusitaniella coriacea LEGE 07157]